MFAYLLSLVFEGWKPLFFINVGPTGTTYIYRPRDTSFQPLTQKKMGRWVPTCPAKKTWQPSKVRKSQHLTQRWAPTMWVHFAWMVASLRDLWSLTVYSPSSFSSLVGRRGVALFSEESGREKRLDDLLGIHGLVSFSIACSLDIFLVIQFHLYFGWVF